MYHCKMKWKTSKIVAILKNGTQIVKQQIEGIIHRPKDESEFLAKRKAFEANIFKFFLKGEPISKFWGAANQNTYLSLFSTISNVYASWKFFMCLSPHTPWKFLPFNLPPLPRNFHWPSMGVWIFSGTTQWQFRNIVYCLL